MDRLFKSFSSRITLSVFLLGFYSIAIADENTNSISIPFTQAGNLIIVSAKADHLSGNFIFDTGSEYLILNKQHANNGSNKKNIISIGNTGKFEVNELHVDIFQLDQMEITDLRAHVVDLHQIELKKNIKIMGIIGYNVFQFFEIVIDYPNHRITLSKVNKKGMRLDMESSTEFPCDSLPFTLDRHFIVLKVSVNGVNLKFYLDSGAELNMIDKKVGQKVLENFTTVKQVNMVGPCNKKKMATAGTLMNVKCAHQYSPKMNTILTSLTEINTSLEVNIDGVLGYEFLKERKILINYQKKMLYFFDPGLIAGM